VSIARTGGLVFSAVLLLSHGAAADQPPCEAILRVEPMRAYVGEQVLYGLEIRRGENIRGVHWARPLAAPGFRMESLPTRTNVPPVAGETRSRAIEERRALFPTRAGELEIPPASLRCTLVSEHGEREIEVDVPAARVRVLPVPSRGRPEGFGGLVGRLAVSSRVEPAELELGGSASLTVLVEGRANLWALPAPFDADRSPIPNVDLLARPPELTRIAGWELRLRRTFSYDLVPRTEGDFEVPEILVPYFDPQTARFVVARAPPLAVRVRVSAGPTREARGTAPSDTLQASEPEPSDPRLPGVAGWLVVGALAIAVVVFARSRRRAEPGREIQELLDRAAQEREDGEIVRSNASIARALRTALERRLPGARSRSAEEILASAGDDADLRHAARLLCELDGVRFSGALDRAPDPEAAGRAALRLGE
jgi:hypothetical protein